MFIIENQVLLLILFFVAGCGLTYRLMCKPEGDPAWKWADLAWVLLGGLGALGAVLAGVYQEDTTQLERQIGVAYAANIAFERDAARFRLRYCEGGPTGPEAVLCNKADLLSASTAENTALPLFLSLTREVSALDGLRLFGSGSEMAGMSAGAEALNTDELLVFAAKDAETQAALETLRRRDPVIAGDYQVLSDSYEQQIAQVEALRQEWQVLQSSFFILVLQILSLCMVSFAAPFRLGKSLVELRQR